MNFDIDEMLCGGRVPSQDELLPADFRDRFGLDSVHQLGLSVPSVVETAGRLEEKGIGPFFIAEDDLALWIERGERKFFHGKLGMAYFGGYELELLEAGEGSTFYSQAFRPDGLIALHHVGLLDSRVDYRVRQLNEAGIETAVRGKIKMGPLKVNFAYMDARDEVGLIVEFIDYRIAGLSMKPSAGVMKGAARLMKRLGRNQLRMGKSM